MGCKDSRCVGIGNWATLAITFALPLTRTMKTFDPANLSIGELHGYLVGAVGPRPVAFASTIDPMVGPT
jgi:hypothetical protein